MNRFVSGSESHRVVIRRMAFAAVAAVACVAPASAQYYQKYFSVAPNASIRPEAVIERTNTAMGGHAVAGQLMAGLELQYVSLHALDGVFLTANAWATPGNGDEGATTIRTVDLSPDYIVAGFQRNLTGAGLDLTLTGIDGAANVLWAAVYFGSSAPMDEASQLARYYASVRNAPLSPVAPSGFATVTTYRAGVGNIDRGQFLRTDLFGNQLVHRLYLPPTIFGPADLSFTDLRSDPINGGWVVTGTLRYGTQPIPGGPFVDNRFPLLVRLDDLGNVIFARAYYINPGAAGTQPDSTGLGITIHPTSGEITITGRTNYFSPGPGTHVLRLTPAGGILWGRTFREFAAGNGAIDEDAAGLVSIGGTDLGAPEIGPSLLVVTPAGAPVLRREYLPPPASPPAAALGIDAVPNVLAPTGWSVVGFREQVAGFLDLHLLRTDASGRTGCFERAVDPGMQVPILDMIDIQITPMLQDLWTFRNVNQARPLPVEQVICSGACTCPGDADGNGVVNFADVTSVLVNFGNVYAPFSGPGDANCDGVVAFADVTAVLVSFGKICP